MFSEDDWFSRLLVNLLGYSLVLVPGFVLVWMVRHNFCFSSFRNNRLVQAFAFGCDSPNDGVDQERLLPTTIKSIEDSSSTGSSQLFRISLLLYCFFGLQFSYLTWGVLQEKIMTTEYQVQSGDQLIGGDVVTVISINSESQHLVSKNLEQPKYFIKFRNSQFLVLVNRILAFIFAVAAIVIMNTRNSRPNMTDSTRRGRPPLYEYVFCSLSNVLSSWCQYEALKFVSFPVQVLSKACKLLPVMLMSKIVSGKKYKNIEYVFAISISFGMTLFLWSDHESNKHSKTHSTGLNYGGGIIILVLYLTFDSFTSNWQGKLFDKYKMSTWHMMGAVNFYSILLTSTSLTQQGDLLPAFGIVLNNFTLFRDCILLSFCSASGQLFVFYTIANFGPIVFVTIMTLRQAIAILLSCMIYDHKLSAFGIVGVLLVFVTLFTQIFWKSRNKTKR